MWIKSHTHGAGWGDYTHPLIWRWWLILFVGSRLKLIFQKYWTGFDRIHLIINDLILHLMIFDDLSQFQNVIIIIMMMLMMIKLESWFVIIGFFDVNHSFTDKELTINLECSMEQWLEHSAVNLLIMVSNLGYTCSYGIFVYFGRSYSDHYHPS